MANRHKSLAPRLKRKQLLFISFVEGGMVMVTELAGARVLTPYFGASLYSWASTLSITLLALMLGYYAGGYATTRPAWASAKRVVWVFFCSAVSVAFMPLLGHLVMQRTIGFSFLPGLIFSQLIFLFLPIFLMGMISPMIIHQLTPTAEQSGKTAGTVYAVSTCGGIIFTLVFGFMIIPTFGIATPVRLLGILSVFVALYFLLCLRSKNIPAGVTLSILCIALSPFAKADFLPFSNKKILEYSEGLLGELQVLDELVRGPDGKEVKIRKLRTNSIQQNYVFADYPTQSLLNYVNFTGQLLSFLPRKKEALLVGLGAGSLYTILTKHGMNVESVEIDERIYEMGRKYFSLPEHPHVITDGRYYLNITDKKYDLVVLDVIIGEAVPAQLITLEAFRRCSDILNNKGVLILEYGGVPRFKGNVFVPSVVKTLKEAGFHVLAFNPVGNNVAGDVLFVASREPLDLENRHIRDDFFIQGGPLRNYLLPLSIFNEEEACLLTDDCNSADILLKDHYFMVREGIRKEIARYQAFKR